MLLNNDNGIKQKKGKLKLWQWIVLMGVLALFLIATVVLCVFYKDAIFTENTLAITLICVSALVFIIGAMISYKYFGR